MTTRVIPPTTSFIGTANGRTFTGSAYYDVADQDAAILTANGFVAFGANHHGLSGATSARPVPGGGSFTDTTLGKVVTFVPDIPLLGVNGHWLDYQGNVV